MPDHAAGDENDARAIAELFLRPRTHYSRAEAARLLRLPRSGISGLVAQGVLEPLAGRPERFAWHDLAHVALTERWTPRIVSELLRREAPGAALPQALQLMTVWLRLPLHLVQAFEALATVQAESRGVAYELSDAVEAALSLHLEGLSDEERERVLAMVPGLREAMGWGDG